MENNRTFHFIDINLLRLSVNSNSSNYIGNMNTCQCIQKQTNMLLSLSLSLSLSEIIICRATKATPQLPILKEII